MSRATDDAYKSVFTPPGEGRTAPLQGSRRGLEPRRIPWEVHKAAWRGYDAYGHYDQSADRVAERGGFGYLEIIAGLWAEHVRLEQALRKIAAANALQVDAQGWMQLVEFAREALVQKDGSAP